MSLKHSLVLVFSDEMTSIVDEVVGPNSKDKTDLLASIEIDEAFLYRFKF